MADKRRSTVGPFDRPQRPAISLESVSVSVGQFVSQYCPQAGPDDWILQRTETRGDQAFWSKQSNNGHSNHERPTVAYQNNRIIVQIIFGLFQWKPFTKRRTLFPDSVQSWL